MLLLFIFLSKDNEEQQFRINCPRLVNQLSNDIINFFFETLKEYTMIGEINKVENIQFLIFLYFHLKQAIMNLIKGHNGKLMQARLSSRAH